MTKTLSRSRTTHAASCCTSGTAAHEPAAARSRGDACRWGTELMGLYASLTGQGVPCLTNGVAPLACNKLGTDDTSRGSMHGTRQVLSVACNVQATHVPHHGVSGMRRL